VRFGFPRRADERNGKDLSAFKDWAAFSQESRQFASENLNENVGGLLADDGRDDAG
jgi:hypothetical protein